MESETDLDLLEPALAIAMLATEKRRAYGNSFNKVGHIMTILYPDGIPPAAYKDALATVRVLDKVVRIATSLGNPDLMNEDPWRDILGYALLSVASNKE